MWLFMIFMIGYTGIVSPNVLKATCQTFNFEVVKKKHEKYHHIY